MRDSHLKPNRIHQKFQLILNESETLGEGLAHLRDPFRFLHS